MVTRLFSFAFSLLENPLDFEKCLPKCLPCPFSVHLILTWVLDGDSSTIIGKIENTARANDFSFRSVRVRPIWPPANAVFPSGLYHRSSPEVKKRRQGGVSVLLAFLINAWYSVNDPGFGSV